MKKLNLFFAAMIGLLCAQVDAGEIRWTYLNDQDRAKQEIFFKDGNSFAQAEENFRARYPELTIPPMKLLKQTFYLNGQPTNFTVVSGVENVSIPTSEISGEYNPTANVLCFDAESISNTRERVFNYVALHETGHAQYPYVTFMRDGVAALSGLTAMYFWGRHKSKPYKNMLTKLGSKCFAATGVGALTFTNVNKAEECRADAYANKHADAQALQGGVECFSQVKEFHRECLSRVCPGLPYSVGQYILSPFYPSTDSRIAKCKKALKNRFGIEA